MTKEEIQYARWCVEHDTHKFYIWGKWLDVREKVLKSDKYECQTCRHKYKRYRKATIVHHIKHLRDRPDLALEACYTDPVTHQTERNLVSLCHDCHEEAHGFRMPDKGAPLTEERWD